MQKNKKINKGFYIRFAERSVICFILILALAATGAFRVFFIKIDEKFIETANLENTYTFEYQNSRGMILDYAGLPLTNVEEKTLALITPSTNAIISLQDYFNDNSKKEILNQLKGNKPILTEVNSLVNANGIYGFIKKERYSKTTLAKHLIGYLDSTNNGVFGIEKGLNNILFSKENLSVSIPCNAKGEIIYGTKPEFKGKISENYVSLTIDSRIQKIAEEASANLKKGAVIVTEVTTGKIRAMVSKPDFDQTNIAESLNSSDSPLVNRALQEYNVGSIFKPCLAAAALESNLQGYKYTCTGSCNIDGQNFKCHKQSGHGEMTLKKAIEQSCNTYFYNLSQIIDKDLLYNIITHLGFKSEVNLNGGIVSKKGNITSLEKLKTSKRSLANFAIGQGDILLSPLVMSNLYNAIANNGHYSKLSVIEKTSLNSNEEYIGESVKVFSERTSNYLKESLLSVVLNGTGKQAKSEIITSAGKTATAETGWKINNINAVHKWFCGIFPYNKPLYTVVVFVENANSGGEDSAIIFKKITEDMNILIQNT